MAIKINQRTTCRLCSEKNLETALHLKPTPLEDDFLPANKADQSRQCFPLDVVLCQNCGHSQLSHVIAAESIYDHYIYQSNTSPGLIKHFEESCDHLIQTVRLSQNNLVVDLGCNDGAVLEIYRNKEMRVVGVEPSPVGKIVSQKNIPVYQTYFNQETASDIVSHHGLASLVTANNVFANIDDLNEFTDAIKLMLAPDGVFVIETGHWPSLLKNNVFDYIYHEHLSYFSIKPLQLFFEKHDLTIYDAGCTEMKGGSVRIFVQRKNGARPVSAQLNNLIHEETNSGAFDLLVYQNFQKRLQNAKTNCHELLDQLGATKQNTAGYGASPSVTTLLHLFELGDRINFLVDDNLIKHNTVSPGHHLPVYPSSAICASNIQYALILPWRFSKNIVSKNSAFLKKGGRFIEVYPTQAIVSYENEKTTI